MKKDIRIICKMHIFIIIAVILIVIPIVIIILKVTNSESKRGSISTKSNVYEVAKSYNISQNKVFALTSLAEFKDFAINNANKDAHKDDNKDANKDTINDANAVENALIAQVEEIEDIKSFVKNNDKKTVYNAIIGNDDSENVYLPEVNVAVNKNVMKTNNVQLPVSLLYQLPELPTGCETTSLTTVLNYLGYNVDKCTIADDFLPKCGIGEGSFWNYFLGDPRDQYSLGCYAGPIVTAANAYLKTQGNNHTAHNYSDSSFTTLLQQVEAGYPVILWSTMDLKEARMTYKWEVNGQTIQWTTPEHCVVMIGYDLDAGTVTISDPMRGIVIRDLNTVASKYEQMQSQAVVIKPNQKVVEPVTQPVTGKSTEKSTDKSTEKATEPVTQSVTEKSTEKVTEVTTKKTSETTTQAAENTSGATTQ